MPTLPPSPRPPHDTTSCLLSPPGRSALAVVGVRGPRAVAAVSASFTPRGQQSLAQRPDRSLVFGRWGGPRGEELVIVRRAGDDLEVHCHGGTAAAAAIQANLADVGCPAVSREDWLEVDHHADTDRPQRERIALEAEAALAVARGPHAARILAQQYAGSLANALEQLVASQPAARARLADQLLAWGPLGLRLTTPWRVVVAGPPNAGKSSLVNALAGFSRSIVSPLAGTTRDLLETRLVLNGWDVVLVDTAGLRSDTVDAVEQAGVARAQDATRHADLVVVVTASDTRHTDTVSDLLCPLAPRLQVFSKCDQTPHGTTPPVNTLLTSAQTGQGIEMLAARIVQSLIPNCPAPGTAVPFTKRQLAMITELRAATACSP